MTARKAPARSTETIIVQRTSAGLRDAIFEEIDALRNGQSSPTRANAVAKLATGIVETVRMELEVHRFIGAAAATVSSVGATGSAGLPAPLCLGA